MVNNILSIVIYLIVGGLLGLALILFPIFLISTNKRFILFTAVSLQFFVLVLFLIKLIGGIFL